MPDISMCMNEECTQKETCYRYKAKPSNWQSYADFKQVDGRCEAYWEVEDEDSEDRRRD